MYRLIGIIGIVSLYGTFTNALPVSAIICCFAFVVPFVIYKNEKINKMVFLAIVLLTYYFIYTVLYDWKSLLEYDFFRRDGNAFVSIIPLIVLGSISLHYSISKILDYYIFFITLVNSIFMLMFFLTGGTIISNEPGIYHLLFKAHNAAGGFLMIVCALCLGVCYIKRKRVYYFCLLVNFIGLILTDSRGSVLGLLFGAFALYSVKKNVFKYLLAIFIFLQIIMYTSAYCFAPDNFLTVNLMTVDMLDLNDTMNRVGTFINRFFYLWPRAIYLFLQSPLFGTGFGSYDDWPYRLIGEYGFRMNDSIIVHSESHAHNSYLNILAETGIVGMMLFICFINSIHKYIVDKMRYNPNVASGLLIALWASMAASITEHRIFTPSQMLPFFIILGLFISINNGRVNK